jgi:hypothetical protein
MRTISWRATAFLASMITLSGCRQLSESGQEVFDSPDAAADALARAVFSADTNELLDIMGPDSRALILPADQVQAARDRQVVKAAMSEKWWLEGDGDSARTIVMGNEAWPFPIPIVRANGGWRFDIEAGREELIQRRVGANEIAAMEVAVAFVEAEHEYASRPRNGQPSGVYAQRIASQPWAAGRTVLGRLEHGRPDESHGRVGRQGGGGRLHAGGHGAHRLPRLLLQSAYGPGA